MIKKIIKNVLELPGVDGACIFDKKGVLLHNDLPDFFLTEFLDDLARRVKTLYEAIDENYMACDDYLLKYPHKFILLRRSRHVFLLVAVDPSVNLVSLRMVTNLVLKHITPKVLGEMRSVLADAEAAAEAAAAELAEVEKKAEIAEPPMKVEALPPETTPEASPPPGPPSRGQKVPRPRPTRSFRGTRY